MEELPARRNRAHGIRPKILGAVTACLTTLQSIRPYRHLLRRMDRPVEIDEAGEHEMDRVRAALGWPRRPYRPDPTTTDYYAHIGLSAVGFVQLVRHPKEHFPYVGHWLFGLEVRLRYRGLGIGRLLTQRLIDQSTLENAPELMLLVRTDNLPAVQLYEQLGFRKTTIPGLEEILREEGRKTGSFSIAMRRVLG
jgi:GNAT superfamily N-acetyltransferase